MSKDTNYHAEGKGFFYSHTYTERTDPKNFVKHLHTDYELLYVKTIEDGVMNVEGILYPIANHSLFLIEPGKYHFITPAPSCAYERFVFNFAKDLFPPATLHSLENGNVMIGDNPLLTQAFARLAQYENLLDEQDFSTVATNTLLELLLLLKKLPKKTARLGEEASDLVGKTIAYVNENAQRIQTLDDIAKAMYASKSTLYHAFQKTMKISIMKYVRNKKILLADEYLKQGIKPTRAYALAGFEDYTTFYRAYKALFGIAPTDKTTDRSILPIK